MKMFGYRIIIWDVDPLDWKRPGPSVRHEPNRETKRSPARSFWRTIFIRRPSKRCPRPSTQLQAKGFKFVTVSELLAMARPPRRSRPATRHEPTGTPLRGEQSRPARAPAPDVPERLEAGMIADNYLQLRS